VLIYGEKRKEINGGEPLTTNNRMELRAAVEALRALAADGNRWPALGGNRAQPCAAGRL
jgi:ribonuclease HI